MLDLSKIEAGQFTLDLADYSLQNVAQTVYNAVESLAVDKNLVFKTEVQSGGVLCVIARHWPWDIER